VRPPGGSPMPFKNSSASDKEHLPTRTCGANRPAYAEASEHLMGKSASSNLR
jgi:hypothetical protein